MISEESREKYGARVFVYSNGTAQVYQTKKKGPKYTDDYIVDKKVKPRFVKPEAGDAALGKAVRTALQGKF